MNGASPAGWAVISIVILRAHGKKGHGATFRCPISSIAASISAILYVDDTDLLHMNLNLDETAAEAHVAIQDSVNSWGELLIATGGASNQRNAFIPLCCSNGLKGSGGIRTTV